MTDSTYFVYKTPYMKEKKTKKIPKKTVVKSVVSDKTIPKLNNDEINITCDENIDKKNIDKLNNKQICASIRNSNEPHLRCLMLTKNNNKYCPIHLSQKKIIDFYWVDDDILERDVKIMESNVDTTNSIIRKLSFDEQDNKKQSVTIKTKQINNSIMYEHKVSTIENSNKETEDELEIKLLILVNDEEYSDKIPELIGPVFNDVTLSEDDQDPVTYDEIWILRNGVRIPASINKYYLFSYQDSKNKIRCLTIFTIYDMIQENNFIHPVTTEQIPDSDIDRAKKLIDLYQTKIGLFRENDLNLSPEFKLKNRLAKLFKQFHIHSIYFEEDWLLSINNKSNLYKIIKETEKIVSNNIKSINSTLHNFKIFQRKETIKPIKPNKKTKETDDDNDSILNLQEYIVDEWEKIIKAADSPQNQIPIWILASGLSFVVPQVKQKYPDLEIML